MKMETIKETENILIELLEFAKSQKIEFVEYEGKKYNVNDYTFKKYYTIYDKNDFYINEFRTLQELQKFFEIETSNSMSAMIQQHNQIKNQYSIYTTYEMTI